MDFPTHTYPGASYFVSLHCVVLENIHTTPPLPPRRATEIQRGWGGGGGGAKRRQIPGGGGGGGGGGQKEAISEGVGVAYRGFFSRGSEYVR